MDDAWVAPDASGESQLSSVPVRALINRQLAATAIGTLEHMLIEAILSLGLGVGTETPFHVTQVGSVEVHLDIDDLSS